jgi:transcriptional regulator with XRE-family HTH domain
MTLEASSFAKSLVLSGGVNAFAMPIISHIAKHCARVNFAMSGGTGMGQLLHYSLMAKKAKIQWYAREWRKKKGFSLEQAAGRASMAVSYLSDLEKGNRRWNQDHLDILSNAYGIDPEDLFWNPEKGPPLWRIIDGIKPEDQAQAAKILETFAKKTGTKN